MVTLREFLSQRRAEVQAQIKALRAELTEIDAAERALSGTDEKSPARPRGTAGTGKKTMKEMALEALSEHPEGLEAQAMLAWIKEKYGQEIPRENFSPQLSRLGQEGQVVRKGLVWRLAILDGLADKPPKDETPGVQPPGASDQETDVFALLGIPPVPAPEGA